jgi:hypothetical protein
MRSLALTLRAHIERDGCHHERFDAYLDDELISTSRSGWHDPARKLLELGHDPETLLHVQHHGRAFDPTIARASAGLLGGYLQVMGDARRDRAGSPDFLPGSLS